MAAKTAVGLCSGSPIPMKTRLVMGGGACCDCCGRGCGCGGRVGENELAAAEEEVEKAEFEPAAVVGKAVADEAGCCCASRCSSC